MAEKGDVAFCLLLSAGDTKPVCGWCVDVSDGEVVIATLPAVVSEIEHRSVIEVGDLQVGFVRVPLESITLSLPADWKGSKPKDLPSLAVCERGWQKGSQRELQSSEAEQLQPVRPKVKKSLMEDLKGLQGLYRGAEVEDTEDDDDEESDEEDGPRRRGKFLPPGGSSNPRKDRAKDPERKKKSEVDINQMLQKGLASGQSPTELMPMMMMAMLMNQQKPKQKSKGDRQRKSILGGSDSESSGSDGFERGKGMKAVSQLYKLHDQIERRPKRICELFEQEVIEELGVVRGQPWTLRDYVKKQPWGKFRGIYRCCMMDVAVYERLRAGEADIAAAQVVQNIKAKLQSVLQQGEWTTAWLLTGLPDPLSKREFAGSKEEMAVVSGYVDALAKLQKRVKENQGRSHGEEEADEPASSSNRK